MKKLLCLMASLALLAGCTRELESRLSDVESRLAKVEDQVKELNSQVSLIQQLLNGKYFIHFLYYSWNFCNNVIDRLHNKEGFIRHW